MFLFLFLPLSSESFDPLTISSFLTFCDYKREGVSKIREDFAKSLAFLCEIPEDGLWGVFLPA